MATVRFVMTCIVGLALVAPATTTSTTSSTTTTMIGDARAPMVEFADPPLNSHTTASSTPHFYFTAFDCETPAVATYCSVAGDPFAPCTSPFTTRALPDGT